MTPVFSRKALVSTLAMGALLLPLALRAEEAATTASGDACTTLQCIREKRKAMHETGKTEKKAIRETAKANTQERRAKFVECIKAAATSEDVEAVVTAAKACIEALRTERQTDRSVMKDKRKELRTNMKEGRTSLREEKKIVKKTYTRPVKSSSSSSVSTSAAASSVTTSAAASSAATSAQASSAATSAASSTVNP